MDKELIQLALAIYDFKEALEWRMYEIKNSHINTYFTQ